VVGGEVVERVGVGDGHADLPQSEIE
jgi:hypothetical protein